jgi:cyclic pyranopterin phosphate synthase
MPLRDSESAVFSHRLPLPMTSDFPASIRWEGQNDEEPRLIDRFGRVHTNLRISVTDRCNLRCTYCMPEEVVFRDRNELLTFEEIRDLVRIAVGLGINKVRLTGGEPLLRRDLPTLVAMLTAISGLDDLSLTTNGVLLERFAEQLFAAGLRRLNVSLDTLDPERFRELARRDELDRVLAGLKAAQRAGFHPIKVNAVAIRGWIERDAVPLARFCREYGLELRFIEYMPIGADPWEREKVVTAAELLRKLAEEVGPLWPASGSDPHAPASDFEYADGGGRVGVIASVSQPFCGSCNRMRLTAEGKLRNCLFALEEIDIKPFLRRAIPDHEGIIAAFRQSVRSKWAGHRFNTDEFVKPDRTMHAIGG